MKNKKIIVSQTESGNYEITVAGRPSVRELSQALTTLADGGSRAITVNMRAPSASDFMLIQFLALLKREGNAVLLRWTDREPSFPIQAMLGC